MPARMKANGNFSDASVEQFYSVRIKSLFEFQVVHRYVFIVV